MFFKRKSPGVTLLEVHEVGTSVVELVRISEERLLLISPYFKPWRHLEDAITEVMAAGVKVDYLVRTEQINKTRAHFLRLGLEPRALKRLHAKMYLNERAVILTSMNLYDGSRESREFGVRIERAKQPVLYQACYSQALDHFEKGEPCDLRVKKAPDKVQNASVSSSRKPKKVQTEKKPLTSSEYESLKLWRRGMSISKIATERGIEETTVYSHLAAPIREGWIKVEKVLVPASRKAIGVGLSKAGEGASLGAIVRATPRKVTYGEAACLLAAWEAHRNTENIL